MSLNNFTLAAHRTYLKPNLPKTQNMLKQRQGRRERRRLDPKLTNCVYRCRGGPARVTIAPPALNQN